MSQTNVNRRRVLIVDEQVNVAWTLQDGLEVLPDCEIAVATDGAEALRLFQARPFDLLITDYMMPGINGVDLAMHIQQRYPHTAIIMLTTFNSEALRTQAARAFIHRVLAKPVALADIRGAAAEALQQSTGSGVASHHI